MPITLVCITSWNWSCRAANQVLPEEASRNQESRCSRALGEHGQPSPSERWYRRIQQGSERPEWSPTNKSLNNAKQENCKYSSTKEDGGRPELRVIHRIWLGISCFSEVQYPLQVTSIQRNDKVAEQRLVVRQLRNRLYSQELCRCGTTINCEGWQQRREAIHNWVFDGRVEQCRLTAGNDGDTAARGRDADETLDPTADAAAGCSAFTCSFEKASARWPSVFEVDLEFHINWSSIIQRQSCWAGVSDLWLRGVRQGAPSVARSPRPVHPRRCSWQDYWRRVLQQSGRELACAD